MVVAATDERQAGIVFGTARRMVELDEALTSRVQVYGSWRPSVAHHSKSLPAEPKRLEGLDFTTAIRDEIGVVSRETTRLWPWRQGKRETSTPLVDQCRVVTAVLARQDHWEVW